MSLKTIMVITPEYGEFAKVGGLAVMIEDLCNGFVKLNEKIIVIMPYYNRDWAGKFDYLKEKGAEFVKTIKV